MYSECLRETQVGHRDFAAVHALLAAKAFWLATSDDMFLTLNQNIHLLHRPQDVVGRTLAEPTLHVLVCRIELQVPLHCLLLLLQVLLRLGAEGHRRRRRRRQRLRRKHVLHSVEDQTAKSR